MAGGDVVVVVGTDKGAIVARSNGAREDWKISGPLFKGWKVTAAARDEGGRVYFGLASMVYGPSIQRTDDPAMDADSFQQIEAGPAFPENGETKLEQIWRIRPAGDKVYCGVAEAGLFVSEDRGETWSPLDGLNRHETREGWYPGAGGMCCHSILVDPADPDRIWVGISAVGVFRSEDGGKTWTPRNAGVPVIIEDEKHCDIGFCVHSIVADPARADTIWRQDHRGMFRTENGGDSWEKIEEGLPSGFGFPLVRDPHTGALFCYPQESDQARVSPEGRLRVYRSTDRGDSWHALTEGLEQANAWTGVLRTSMAVDGCDPCGVYFGTTSGTVHASRDGGDTWSRLPVILPRVHCVSAWVEAS